MNYLNTIAPFQAFQEAVNSRFFVDKTMMIKNVTRRLGTYDHYLCITRPHGFGKSMNAAMLAAFYSKAADASELFADKKIAVEQGCMQHLNQYNVFYLPMSENLDEYNRYNDYISDIYQKIADDIYESCPDLRGKEFSSLSTLLSQTGKKFIFIIDDWDAILSQKFMTLRDKCSYLSFWGSLLKDKVYTKLVYMTGVCPIFNYKHDSSMNMFSEYTAVYDGRYDHFFGFTEVEVRELCKNTAAPAFEELKEWYGGYRTADGESLFNPLSASLALSNGVCRNYWTQPDTTSKIKYLINHNAEDTHRDLVQLISGNPVDIYLDGYTINQPLETRKDIFYSMVLFGFLTYVNRKITIPNCELMEKFKQVSIIPETKQ